MFHQADDIKLVLAPFDLRQDGLAITCASGTSMSAKTLLQNVAADLAQRAGSSSSTYSFLAEHGLEDEISAASTRPPDAQSATIALVLADPVAAYEKGLEEFKSGDITTAVVTFAILSGRPDLRSSCLAALAACACFQSAYHVSLEFAQESLEHKENHPRINVIAGYSALKAGEKKVAKRQLALATRLARGNPQYRDEQRCAQRELLLMQLTS